jgi:histidinol phosphatase-like enzyme
VGRGWHVVRHVPGNLARVQGCAPRVRAGCLARKDRRPRPGLAADAYPRKPDPAAFNAIIERHGLVRDETMAIGDRDIDVLAGRSAVD